MSEDGTVRMVIGKLFQMRGAVELKAGLVNTVLSAGCDSILLSDDRSWRDGGRYAGPIGVLADR